MGTVSFSAVANMNNTSVWYGTVTVANASHIQIISGAKQGDYYGSFSYNYTTGQLTGGTLNSYYTYSSGVLQSSATGFSLSATTFNNFLVAGDGLGAISWALSGNDTINGSTGSDILNAYAGNDTINAGAGADTLNGGVGNDTLNGGAGADTLYGGLGNDTYVVDNVLDVTAETSTLPTEIDTVQSSVARTLGANLENLTLIGASAINGTGNGLNNTITGNAAANILNGGAGADILIGGTGKDTLTGGIGADKFDFNAPTESAVGSACDIIKDFVRAQGDKIDLNGIDANTAVVGNQNFTGLIASTATFTTAGQLQFKAGVLYGNTDADAAAEFSIALTGVTSLLASDFIL